MGADSLKDDYMSEMLLTNNAMSFIIKTFKGLFKNIIVMGGGGYNPWTTLRAWIYNLATLSGEEEKLKLNLSAKNFLKKITWKIKPKKNWIEEVVDEPNVFNDNVKL
jgi:acetoin utilization protein AcuC